MDFLPTFAGLAGTSAPDDRTIDGKDIAPLMFGAPGAASPHEAFFYYMREDLECVRAGQWKLRVKAEDGRLLRDRHELYDLAADVGETTNVAGDRQDVVRDLEEKMQACREDLGDAATGVAGANRRPCGRVANPKPLTEYDPAHPYILAMYDLPNAG
jgi:arylsulfatase A-like enzyme